MIDFDHLKPCNDTYDYLAGDEALRQISAQLKKQAKRNGDQIYRYGGEAFILLLSGIIAGLC